MYVQGEAEIDILNKFFFFGEDGVGLYGYGIDLCGMEFVNHRVVQGKGRELGIYWSTSFGRGYVFDWRDSYSYI